MRRQRGFTLTEIAIAFTIVALLIAGFMYTLAAQTAQRERSDTLRSLEEARELLIAFAIVNGRLPCPAAPPPIFPFNAGGTGIESPVGGACTDAFTGFLPARAIGFQPADANGYGLDAWNNPIRYAVSRDSDPAAGQNWNFTTLGMMKASGISVMPQDLIICSTGVGALAADCSGAATRVTNPNVVVAVLWSQGKNFREKTSGGIPGAVLGASEGLNHKHRSFPGPVLLNNTPVFVHTTPAPVGALGGGEYDDLMVWLPVGTLYGRLVAAGVLP
jgi:prepilin-type N-terminal cleavage/methylation domain-containing protein